MEATAERRLVAAAAKQRVLMCPYYAYKPFHYLEVRECSGRGWNIHQLKSHLYQHHFTEHLCRYGCKGFKSQEELEKHHSARYRCENCCKELTSKKSLDKHLATGETCVRRTQAIEGFGLDVKRKIQNRTPPPGHADMTPEEKSEQIWYNIFRYIFPEVDELFYPLAFYDQKRVLPRQKLARALEASLEQGPDAILDSVMTTIFPHIPRAPPSSMAPGDPDISRSGGDAADGTEDAEDLLDWWEEEPRAAIVHNTRGFGDWTDAGEQANTINPILLHGNDAPITDHIPAVLNDTAQALPPYHGAQEFGVYAHEYLGNPEWTWAERPIETPPDTTMTGADEW